MNKLIKFIFIFFLLNTLNLSNSFADISKVDEITKNLRCLICQGQSIYDSNSDFALSVKTLVSEKLESGDTEKDIYSFLKSKYGDWIVYEPEFNKYTLALWILPLFLFIFGGLLIVRKVFINRSIK
jgi:cytochrome c-type biogenesis protein CcmH|tara:strand:+ start:809 stop:1186 length:378 start_codon:yes stop_codon:yes gene_type:complete